MIKSNGTSACRGIQCHSDQASAMSLRAQLRASAHRKPIQYLFTRPPARSIESVKRVSGYSNTSADADIFAAASEENERLRCASACFICQACVGSSSLN